MSIDIEEQYDKIYRYCYYKTGNATLAEDLTQEAFLKYFAQNSYMEYGKKLAYLYTVARNLCIDYFRRKQPENLTDELQDTDFIERLEMKSTVRQALQTLPEQEQELLLFRYANELSVGEIAAITGLSRFAVYRRIKSALASLKKLLGEENSL
ncbi:RNA polymerase sigma factor [Ruminiclostridium cellobioparum]|uniref:RNA polymerase sigma factor, sigma-70 family n=1 Tax=Ruminiclostridium cellobioparum subsp. termitidis CT1112 TaxID=1195236 RepID=S0FIT8_RUMCE|nr:RNA polymerase sigma factor [Ruminiclostridium cellobioparum]EMS70116.1 RNA polymerase sigma factor, sigma-70 family [Ruminiclostridium cellobioparum subsp. termitidis CT1112]